MGKSVDSDYDGKRIVAYVKPKVFGNYTATITSLEDPENRITRIPNIFYAFGFISPLSSGLYGVSNPVGTAFELITVIGGSSIIPGIILIIYVLVKASPKK